MTAAHHADEGDRSRARGALLPALIAMLAAALSVAGFAPGTDAADDPLAGVTTEVPDSLYLPAPEAPAPPVEPAPAEPGPAEPAPAPAWPGQESFASRYPEHAAARQVDGDPSSFHWAVIIGVNDYQGSTGSTLGSVADATVLRDALFARGWRGDHVLTLTEGAATRAGIVQAMEWLAAKTDERSTVVFSSSGHMRHKGGSSAIWPVDNNYLWNADFGRQLAPIRADRMWVSIQGCHAEGMRAAGVEGPNRVVTYSSRTAEKSYEDPEVGHSVQGNYLFREGIREGWGNNGVASGVTVQGAFAWAAPRATTRTAGQQTPVIVDGLGRPFTLDITGPPGA